MKKLLFVAVVSLALAACGNKDAAVLAPESKAEAMHITDVSQDMVATGAASNQAAVMDVSRSGKEVNYGQQAEIEKKIIKEGDISFETDNVIDTRKQLLASLKKLGGYVSEDNEFVNGEDNRKQYLLNIRIPAKNFDAFLGNVSSEATKIDSKSIQIRDITTEYIDVKTRLDNKKILEKRYLGLLDKAGKMSDVLEIEAKLSEIRSDIESSQGQLNYMNKQVDYSSLSITFYTKQTEQVATGNTFGYKFKHAVTSGLMFMQSLFFGFISLWPVWILVVIVIVVIRRRRKSKNE